MPQIEHIRHAGDDVVVQVRVRRVNLPALEAGIQLGVDHHTGHPIELALLPGADGVHNLRVVTNSMVAASAPDAVDAIPVRGEDR